MLTSDLWNLEIWILSLSGAMMRKAVRALSELSSDVVLPNSLAAKTVGLARSGFPLARTCSRSRSRAWLAKSGMRRR
jgi:hypothetical protein